MSQLCGSKAFINQSSNFQITLIGCGLFTVAVVYCMLRLMVRWITLKDYFPLKERSPMLCIVLLLILGIELVLYPIQILVNYFLTGQETSEVFRILYCTLKTMGAFIYVVRTLRIHYAYNLQDNMRSHWVFRLFKHEWYLVFLVFVLLILRAIPPIVFPEQYPSPVNTNTENSDIFFIRTLIEEVIWQMLLLACMWVQRNIRVEFGILKEIGSILIFSLLVTLTELVITVTQMLKYDTPLSQVLSVFQCYEYSYPLNEFTAMGTSLVMLIASLMFPLTKIKQEHQLLPIQQMYDLQSNLRAFLLQPQYFKTFYNFLKQIQQKESAQDSRARVPYTTLINFWAKITKFKLQQNPDSTELVMFLRELDSSVFGKNIVNSLNQSFQRLNDDLELRQRQHVRNSINAALEELEDNVITQLSVVYKDRFRKTHAFAYLKKSMVDNERINTNLLMLNMILREHAEL